MANEVATVPISETCRISLSFKDRCIELVGHHHTVHVGGLARGQNIQRDSGASYKIFFCVLKVMSAKRKYPTLLADRHRLYVGGITTLMLKASLNPSRLTARRAGGSAGSEGDDGSIFSSVVLFTAETSWLLI